MKSIVNELVKMVGGTANGSGNGSGSSGLRKMIPGGMTAKIAPQIPKAGTAKRKAVVHKANEVNPQQVIPLDNADFQDF